MSSLWKGVIALPDGLPQSSLESIEFLSSTPDAGNAYNPKPEADGTIFKGAELRVQAVVEAHRVPLWLSCGPSFDVQTENEGTANFLMNIFVQQASRERPSEAEDKEDKEDEEDEEDEEAREVEKNNEDKPNDPSEATEYKSTNKALVVRVTYETTPEEIEKPIITELVLYGTLSSDVLPSETPQPSNAESQTAPVPPTGPPSLSVYALPLSSRLLKEKKLQTSVKSESLEPGKARFLAPIIGRKRKFHAVFTEYDKKQAYYATLPPGLRRSWHKRSGSIASLQEEINENSASVGNGDSQKSRLFSRSVGPGAMSQPVTTNDFRKTINEDPRYRRERSTSVLQARLREAAERPDPPRRESSLKPIRTSGDYTALRRAETFAGSRTRNQTPETRPGSGVSNNANDGTGLAGSMAAVPTTNKFAERNKVAAQKLILASMRLYGFTRAKAGEVKVESDEEEYKLVFHTTLRSLICAMRKSWNSEIIGISRLKETTEYLMKAFVGGSGVVHGSSDREEDDLKDKEEENPFSKSRIGRLSVVLSGAVSRDDTLIGEESILGNSLLGESLLGDGPMSDD
ncbi:hypothetical protein TWF506_009791 [Arthrobotrys conoides]|uniref:Sld7 C-terminal domain-containing protein n=1 Tax=Arthrobotrys conoides TaxID=74498 RepID=A0AAN8NG19_9PEZI